MHLFAIAGRVELVVTLTTNKKATIALYLLDKAVDKKALVTTWAGTNFKLVAAKFDHG